MDNLLSLEEFREQLSYNPWHFWGLGGPKVPITSSCNSIVKKYAWQSTDAAGRNDIAESIASSEKRLMSLLGYSPAPHYKEVNLQFPRFPNEQIYKLGYTGADSRWISVRLPESQIREVGIEKLTSLGDVDLVYSDEDGDSILDTFTGSVATTETDSEKICIYFSSADRLDSSGLSDTWRIRPIQVTISGGIATFVGRSWMTTYPVLHEGYGKDAVDASDPDVYVETVEVAIRETDPDGTTYDTCQGLLIWESTPYPAWTGFITQDPAGLAYAIARVGIRDAENGEVYFGEATPNPSDGKWYGVPWYDSAYRFRPPDRVVIRYLAGYPLNDNNRMSTETKTMDFRLSAAEMPRRICACDSANRNLQYWQFDLARTGGANGEAYGMISSSDLSNPLGTLRGQVLAWKDIKNRRHLTGFAT